MQTHSQPRSLHSGQGQPSRSFRGSTNITAASPAACNEGHCCSASGEPPLPFASNCMTCLHLGAAEALVTQGPAVLQGPFCQMACKGYPDLMVQLLPLSSLYGSPYGAAGWMHTSEGLWYYTCSLNVSTPFQEFAAFLDKGKKKTGRSIGICVRA